MNFTGTRGEIAVQVWPHERPRYVAILVHGYGEHIGRYEHVAAALVRHGAAVYGPDHLGHGRSSGERALIEDFEDVVTDVHTVVEQARADHPGVPVVVVGHSMGGMIATRYAQRHGSEPAALVLSGPLIGKWAALEVLAALEEIPDIPIDPATLSRDLTVGEAYAADPLVWHGPFKKPTVDAFARTMEAIAAAGSLGDLPTLWIHGEDDQLIPLDGSRVGIDGIRGTNLTERVYPGARHEVFNETNKDEVLAEVAGFVDRVLTP
ncbi:alpha/beta fold hydrolase [Planomonospora sp. ID67723]|uniref:alpha/beta fold hydrolase n=1 Tax=Planomonospora sp. ID67723 TaxID=2738134 RepID=UPI0018C3D53E|nr:alpha/beta fold hydrolase [Planomonospora sp. ID67723]MBG0826848.1 alpha/beta fold hydrolase [Planomonospora sp. ID67723]